MAYHTPLPVLAKTVSGVINNTDTLAAHIRDRSSPVTEDLVKNVSSLLLIGYPGRRPRSLLDRHGRPRPTDMDLVSFLIHLPEKPTILELPTYTATLPRTVFASERHLSNRRYGNLLALSSHREHFSFGVTIEDMSIIQRSAQEEDMLGSPRTFLIMSHQGVWHEGWQGVSWEFRRNERDFRDRYDLLLDQSHRGYQYFVHPNRRHSIFSRAHLLLKLLWQRLDDEISHLDSPQGDAGSTGKEIISLERSQHILVPTFTMKLTGLPLTGKYPEIHDDTGERIYSRLHFLKQMRTKVQFLVRVNEYAFYQYGREQDYVASWIRGGVWHHSTSSDRYRHQASLPLSREVTLGYTTDMVSKKVAAH